MSNKKLYENKCFSPNWIEVDLEYERTQTTKEERLETKHRKDLKTLLKELDEIKQNIEKVAEKQQRLANLMGFYTGKLVQ
jgi:glutaredoxin 2